MKIGIITYHSADQIIRVTASFCFIVLYLTTVHPYEVLK